MVNDDRTLRDVAAVGDGKTIRTGWVTGGAKEEGFGQQLGNNVGLDSLNAGGNGEKREGRGNRT
jgi:hypothetical protein